MQSSLGAPLVAAIFLLAGCTSPPPPTTNGWQDLGDGLFERPLGWLDFPAVAAQYRVTNQFPLDIPSWGNATLFYMDHGDHDIPGWAKVAGVWACCTPTRTILMGHGGMADRNGTTLYGSSLELAVTAAGVQGVLGVHDTEPPGLPRGDYLVRFRLDEGSHGPRQSVRVEKVDCYLEAGGPGQAGYEWIYGCGLDPVAHEGDVAPQGG